MIKLENVTKRFPGGQEALSGLSLEVDRGEMAFVIVKVACDIKA